MNHFFGDVKPDEIIEAVDTHERAALDAVHALARLADTHPEHALEVGGSLRKIWAIAQSKAQSLSLRTTTIKRREGQGL